MRATRRGFLGTLLALAAAPSAVGFRPTPVAAATAPERYLSVVAFGADPTGGADSRAAIQAAFAAAQASRRTIYFPAGTYRA